MAGSTPWVLPTTQTDLDTDESKCRVVHSQKQELHGAVSARTGVGGHGPPSLLRCSGEHAEIRDPVHGSKRTFPGGWKTVATVRSSEDSPMALAARAPALVPEAVPELRGAPRRRAPTAPRGTRRAPAGSRWVEISRAGGRSCCPWSARCPLTSPTRCGQTGLPMPACRPHTGAKGGSAQLAFTTKAARMDVWGCHLSPPSARPSGGIR